MLYNIASEMSLLYQSHLLHCSSFSLSDVGDKPHIKQLRVVNRVHKTILSIVLAIFITI